MIEGMATGAGDVVGFRFDGEMTAKDYDGTLIPALEEAEKSHPTLRILFHIVNFHGWKSHGHWEGLKDWPGMEKVDRVAIVGGEKWEEWMNHLPGLFVGFTGIDVRYFTDDHLAAALDWLREPVAAEEAAVEMG
ncbi:STAS/SEC14 domain-containing protein [Methanoculleus sp.]|uniref:STAS/SEC14 domain-containing protein n=1 Tax=Methanoculleus sp. TaxID=90427 RepID=UPI001BD59E38|nr:STAS/SEC14 domain-containing protein [Methanoculleus sp.]